MGTQGLQLVRIRYGPCQEAGEDMTRVDRHGSTQLNVSVESANLSVHVGRKQDTWLQI